MQLGIFQKFIIYSFRKYKEKELVYVCLFVEFELIDNY